MLQIKTEAYEQTRNIKEDVAKDDNTFEPINCVMIVNKIKIYM